MKQTLQQKKQMHLAKTNQKIDHFFKPISRIKRPLEKEENSQEKTRASPSPPNSQSKTSKKQYVDENEQEKLVKDTRVVKEKGLIRNEIKENSTSSSKEHPTVKSLGLKSFYERENSPSNQFADRENIGCKISRSVSPNTVAKRQPFKEKPILPVNVNTSTTLPNATASFNVPSEDEASASFFVFKENELNTQSIEETETVTSSILDSGSLYNKENLPTEKFTVYVDAEIRAKSIKSTDTQRSSPLFINYSNSDSEEDLPKLPQQPTQETTPEPVLFNKFDSFSDGFEDTKARSFSDRFENTKAHSCSGGFEDTKAHSFSGFFSDDEEETKVTCNEDLVDDFSIGLPDTIESNNQCKNTFFND